MTIHKLTNAIYLVFLSLWFGSLIMTGIVAGVTFTVLHNIDAQVPAFAESVPSGDHYQIAGGQVMQSVFLLGDFIQLISVVAVFAIVGSQLFSAKIKLPTTPNLIRLAGLTGALLLVCYNVFILSPRMNTNLRKYWDAAEANEDGSAFKKAFDDEHPTASFVLASTAGCLLVVIASSGFMMFPHTEEDERRKVIVSGASQLETPKLLNQT